jgi:hypothetical protein
MVAVRGGSGPRGRPRGPIEMRAICRIADAPTGPVTTEMQRSSSSSPPPDGLMTKGHGPVQPSWGNPNRAAMVPTTTSTAAVMAWADDFVQKRHDEIGKCSSQYLTKFLFLALFVLPSKAHRTVH